MQEKTVTVPVFLKKVQNFVMSVLLRNNKPNVKLASCLSTYQIFENKSQRLVCVYNIM